MPERGRLGCRWSPGPYLDPRANTRWFHRRVFFQITMIRHTQTLSYGLGRGV